MVSSEETADTEDVVDVDVFKSPNPSDLHCASAFPKIVLRLSWAARKDRARL